MKLLSTFWRNRGLVGLLVVFVLLLTLALFLIFQQQIYNSLRPAPSAPTFAAQIVQPGQSWTVLRQDKANFTCVWKKGTSVPDCLNLTPMQYGGAAGFAYVRSDDRRKIVFIFLLRTGRQLHGELRAQDGDTGFQIDSR
jgi:hypothetical protein